MKLFGARAHRKEETLRPGEKKLTRFDAVHERTPSPIAPAISQMPSHRVEERPASYSPRSLVSAMRSGDPIDDLHSEVGIRPDILRNALPGRFRDLDDRKTAGLGPDAFDMTASRT